MRRPVAQDGTLLAQDLLDPGMLWLLHRDSRSRRSWGPLWAAPRSTAVTFHSNKARNTQFGVKDLRFICSNSRHEPTATDPSLQVATPGLCGAPAAP